MNVVLSNHARMRIAERLPDHMEWLREEVAAAWSERRVSRKPPNWATEFAGMRPRRAFETRYIRSMLGERQVCIVVAPANDKADSVVVVTVMVRHNGSKLAGNAATRKAGRHAHNTRGTIGKGRPAA